MKTAFTILLMITAALAVGVSLRFRAQRDSALESRREFCLIVKEAMREDARDFTSGSFQKQELAFERFYDSEVIYHGTQSILMCIETLPSMPIECVVNRDLKCLADIATTIKDSLSSY